VKLLPTGIGPSHTGNKPGGWWLEMIPLVTTVAPPQQEPGQVHWFNQVDRCSQGSKVMDIREQKQLTGINITLFYSERSDPKPRSGQLE
jgi:hypothetical protein